MREPLKLGVTATREGLTGNQRQKLREWLEGRLPDFRADPDSYAAATVGHFHHGACVGGDLDGLVVAAELFDHLAPVIVAHPPDDDALASQAALDRSSIRFPGKPYPERDDDIVVLTQMLLVAPSGLSEERRSGTWSTARRARKLRRPLVIFWPDGVVWEGALSERRWCR